MCSSPLIKIGVSSKTFTLNIGCSHKVVFEDNNLPHLGFDPDQVVNFSLLLESERHFPH